jgi:hypothetical protein
MLDSTSNNNYATSSAQTTSATGQIYNGVSFNGGWVSRLTATDSASLRPTSNETISLWADPTTTNVDQTMVRSGKTNTNENYILDFFTGPVIRYIVKNTIAATYTVTTSALPTNTWSFVTATYDGSDLNLYINGALAAYTQQSAINLNQNTTGFAIGNSPDWVSNNPPFGFSGSIDEVRISNIARSPGWIQTEYNNEATPSAFFTESNVETDIYAPTLSQLLRHGQFFGTQGAESGSIQPFMW